MLVSDEIFRKRTLGDCRRVADCRIDYDSVNLGGVEMARYKLELSGDDTEKVVEFKARTLAGAKAMAIGSFALFTNRAIAQTMRQNKQDGTYESEFAILTDNKIVAYDAILRKI